MEPIGDFEYSKKDLIGHGAFAVVFKGRHKKKHDFVVAIKCITKKNLAKSQSLLSKEIKILKELSDLQHENVVALLDCKETSHHVFLVMEYCNGGDLADFLQAKGTLSEDTISSFLRQIAGAMVALNAKGIVHRDLKPQNILLCNMGRTPNPPPSEIKLKIADFGFARFLQDGVMAATLCGSPMYMAPEVIMSVQYDAKADLWSVGTIVYQCLTGKAPFQAQTPQQLKQFYERNSNLQPNIPPGTSQELKDLLMKLLKRNARERIDFDNFFKHPFLQPATKSSPVPVPRSRSRSSLSDSPKIAAASPLSGQGHFQTPPAVSPGRSVVQQREQSHERMDVGSSPQPSPTQGAAHPPSPCAGLTPARHKSPVQPNAPMAEPEDFVMVPANLPAESEAMITSSTRPASSVDMKELFSEPLRHVTALPASGTVTYKHGTNSPLQFTAAPGRPSTLPVTSPATPTTPRASPSPTLPSTSSPAMGVPSTSSPPSLSQPIPVPTQVKAFEQIQRSVATSPSSPRALASESPKAGSVSGSTPPRGVPIPRKGSTGSVPSVGSISPPQVQFSIGTPPSGNWRRSNPNLTATPPGCSSPHRKSVSGTTPPRLSSLPPSLSPLPTILGSPTKQPGTFQFTTATSETDSESPSSPIKAPFGNPRSRGTCPTISESDRRIVSVTSDTGVFMRSGSSGRLSDQLLRAAFGTVQSSSPSGLPAVLTHPPPHGGPGNPLVPYSSSQTSLQRTTSSPCLPEDQSGATNGMQRRPRTMSCGFEDNSPQAGLLNYATSPSNMEGPIAFVAPTLAEETLMDKNHNETLAKLNFVLTLVECIIELAQARSSPLSTSVMSTTSQDGTGGGQSPPFTLDPVTYLTEAQRHLEQLVLYMRALQLLASSLQLARDEVRATRLQPSNAVKQVVQEMNDYYQQCLSVCRNLNNCSLSGRADLNPHAIAITADKLIYSYAIEMCQAAALDELFGNPQECFRRYNSAQVLLHGLAQQALDDSDRLLLNKYREAVEKRLYNLHSQGIIHAFESSTSS